MKVMGTIAIGVTTAVVTIPLVSGCNVVETLLQAETTDDSISATPNRPPVASAGDDQTAFAGDLVVLNGTGSNDPDVDRLQFTWGQVGGTPIVTLVDGFSSQPRFFAPSITATTALTFRLTVGDGQALSEDEVIITLNPAASQ